MARPVTLGSEAKLRAKSGVTTDVSKGETWLYAPAQPARLVKRMIIAMQRLAELLQRVGKLEETKGNAKQ